MAVTITIDGVDRTGYWLSTAETSISKDHVVEQMTAVFRDVVFSPGAYRPDNGQTVRVLHDADLLFGGRIQTVRESRLDDEGPITVAIDARGLESVMDEIRVTADFPSMDVVVLGHLLFTTHIAPRGYTWIGPIAGGATLPAPLSFEKTKLTDVVSELYKLTGYSLRFNGDYQVAMVRAGSIAAPFSINTLTAQKGLFVVKDRKTKATQLFIHTGTPASGAGPVAHAETHIANGTHTRFPINVESGLKYGAVNYDGGYAAGATAMAIDGMYPGASLQAFDTFTVAGLAGTYVVSGAATSDEHGAFAAVAFSPGLAGPIANDVVITFDRRTFVRLKVNGVETGWSAAWAFDAGTTELVASAPPAAGTSLTYSTPIVFPAWVRVVDGSARSSTGGGVNAAVVVDDVIEAGHITDVSHATAYGVAELAGRVSEPRKLSVPVRNKGVYPLMAILVTQPAHNINAAFLVQKVRVSITAADVRYHLECVEGDRTARPWDQVWREMIGGASGGAIAARGSSVGGGVTSGTGGGAGTLPAGHTIHLAGSNSAPLLATTTFGSAPEAIPTRFGGAGMAGTWTLRVPMYQLAAGTVEAILYDQTTGATLATVSTTQAASNYDISNFAFPFVSFTAPAGIDDVILQVRVTAGSREVIVGHATLVKDA